jgi:hypothetical protein
LIFEFVIFVDLGRVAIGGHNLVMQCLDSCANVIRLKGVLHVLNVRTPWGWWSIIDVAFRHSTINGSRTIARLIGMFVLANPRCIPQS